MELNTNMTGLKAEKLAIAFLQNSNWQVLKHDWRPHNGGQVDIIARRSENCADSPVYCSDTAFFEVKYRKFLLRDANVIGIKQYRRLLSAMHIYNYVYGDTQVERLYLLLILPINNFNRRMLSADRIYVPYTEFRQHYIICYSLC